MHHILFKSVALLSPLRCRTQLFRTVLRLSWLPSQIAHRVATLNPLLEASTLPQLLIGDTLTFTSTSGVLSNYKVLLCRTVPPTAIILRTAPIAITHCLMLRLGALAVSLRVILPLEVARVRHLLLLLLLHFMLVYQSSLLLA